MGDNTTFAEKAREAEALAYSAQYPMFRVFFLRLAKDYRILEQQRSAISEPITE